MTEPRHPEIRLVFSRVSKALCLLTIPSAPPGRELFQTVLQAGIGTSWPPASLQRISHACLLPSLRLQSVACLGGFLQSFCLFEPGGVLTTASNCLHWKWLAFASKLRAPCLNWETRVITSWEAIRRARRSPRPPPESSGFTLPKTLCKCKQLESSGTISMAGVAGAHLGVCPPRSPVCSPCPSLRVP